MKYYGVKSGREIGIFESWADCLSSVHAYPNCEFKSFKKFEDAQLYVYGNVSKKRKTKKRINNSIKAYVDGSYSPEQNKYSYACIIVNGDKIIAKLGGSASKENLLPLTNIAGELCAAKLAVRYALRQGYEKLELYYDCSGIKDLAIGIAVSENPWLRSYGKYMKTAQKNIEIDFKKIRSHSGNKFNEIADELAKSQLSNI